MQRKFIKQNIKLSSDSNTLVKMQQTHRQLGIEFLRILCMLSIIIMHFNGANGNGLEYAETHGLTTLFWLMRIFGIIFCPAVNIFILITGYFMSGKENRSWWKPAKIIFEVMFFHCMVYVLQAIQFHTLSIFGFVKSLLPMNYYAILYVVLYVLSHYIDLVYNKITDSSWTKFTVITFIIFSLWTFGLDILANFAKNDVNNLNPMGLNGSGSGYTFVNFMLMYIVGAWIKRNKTKLNNVNSWKIVSALVLNLIVMAAWFLISNKKNWQSHVEAYNNPLVIANSGLIFILFTRINITSESRIGKAIDIAAKSVFITFLTHIFFLSILKPEMIINDDIVITVLLALAMVVTIYLACFVIYFVYNIFEKTIVNSLKRKFSKWEINYDGVGHRE
jgi:hypothetical protein